MSASHLIQVAINERIAVLTIDNPPANALSLDVLDCLETALCRVQADPRAKIIIITGRGKLFSAGADIRELDALRDRPTGEAYSRKGQALCDLLERSPKPVIAAINGRLVLGGGAELVVACHLRIIEAGAQMGSPESRLGLMTGWGATQRLPRLVGVGRALDLLLTGRRIDATEALAIGLVNRVVPEGSALSAAMEMAGQLAALSAPSLAATLDAVQTGLRQRFDEGMAAEAQRFGSLCSGLDWHEGTSAFLGKRKPDFQDR